MSQIIEGNSGKTEIFDGLAIGCQGGADLVTVMWADLSLIYQSVKGSFGPIFSLTVDKGGKKWGTAVD